MKKYIIIVWLIFTVLNMNAQLLPGGKPDKYEQKKKRKKGSVPRFYSGIGLKGINVLDEWGVEFTIKAGYIVSKHIGVGFNYNAIYSKNLQIDNTNGSVLRMQSISPQIDFMWWLDTYFLISVYANGGLAFISTTNTGNIDILEDLNGDWIWHTEQGVSFNYRMLEELWLTMDAGYRNCFGVDYNSISNEDISGLTFGVTFKVFVF